MKHRSSQQSSDIERRAGRDDVENCYRLFLTRDPEDPNAVTGSVDLPLNAVIASFAVSSEFGSKLGMEGDRLAIDDVMLERIAPELAAWAAAVAGRSAIPGEDTPDRRTAIGAILDSDGIRTAVAATVPEHALAVDLLKAALARLAEIAGVIAASPLFDAAGYALQFPGGERVADLAAHYVLYGERSGLLPSPSFDPALYEKFNADVAASSHNRLFHYEAWGRQEGRSHRDWLTHHAMPPLTSTVERPTIFLLLHEATYTGAPILGWNLVQALSDHGDVVVVLRRGGALEHALRNVASVLIEAPPPCATLDPDEMRRFAEKLISVYRPLYAIANSVETRNVAVALRDQGIPIVALVHEFWPGRQSDVRLNFYARCAALVFPAPIVEQSSLHAFREIGLQNRFLIPQGPCAIPRFEAFASLDLPSPLGVDDHDPPSHAVLPTVEGQDPPFTVIGLGAVEQRKGVDLFMSAATAFKARHPDVPHRFIWIGSWENAAGTEHGDLLREQFERSGSAGNLLFRSPVDDLEPIYAEAHALFLSSRLDPMPNVAIDAALRAIPIVCFSSASGIAELLEADPETTSLVVPHLDSGAASDRLAELAMHSEQRIAAGTAVRRLARRTFDMASYARRIDHIGRDAARKFAESDRDHRLIDDAGIFDAAIFFGAERDDAFGGATAVEAYLDRTRHINFTSLPVFGVILRRPCPGFHPFVYGTEAPGFPQDGSRDPLAHYVECGMPEGRWTHRVIRPDAANWNPPEPPSNMAPVALHGHFHYPETIDEFMVAVDANRFEADLFLTAHSVADAEVLKRATRHYQRGAVVIDVIVNIGRDIYAFLQVLRDRIRGRYEIVGHFHGKRSVHTLGRDPEFGTRWRRFLWGHLLGPDDRVGDAILDAMQRDSRLGLVFPENPWLIGWEKNGGSAAALAQRLGRRDALPAHIEFPSGTMFWARVQALDALIQADFREDEMPVEPLPIDGTLLHAFERMLPLLCEAAGYGYATTYIPPGKPSPAAS